MYMQAMLYLLKIKDQKLLKYEGIKFSYMTKQHSKYLAANDI
jgi:hypothetical protein